MHLRTHNDLSFFLLSFICCLVLDGSDCTLLRRLVDDLVYHLVGIALVFDQQKFHRGFVRVLKFHIHYVAQLRWIRKLFLVRFVQDHYHILTLLASFGTLVLLFFFSSVGQWKW